MRGEHCIANDTVIALTVVIKLGFNKSYVSMIVQFFGQWVALGLSALFGRNNVGYLIVRSSTIVLYLVNDRHLDYRLYLAEITWGT
ncbi:hypothetical protein M0813_04622 [Anaeramoeba flamelloides]|uniref:Uncharacterized protein n=1 Tax=Anaeramoeba flamelloides TaxID=1746091 RepID=A0ABQ8XKH1_9EUKA|nr:hypothetical protein M0813_04622 [Anaeramoeba flamelloides]